MLNFFHIHGSEVFMHDSTPVIRPERQQDILNESK